MAASNLHVPDPYEGSTPQQVNDAAGGEDRSNIQEAMKSKTTSEQTTQTGNIEKKKKKKKKKKTKRSRASLDGVEEEEEIQKTKQVQVAASSTPLVRVDENKSNVKSSSGIYRGQFNAADENEKKMKKEETVLVKEEKEKTPPVQFVENEKKMKKEEPVLVKKEEETLPVQFDVENEKKMKKEEPVLVKKEEEILPVQFVDIEVTSESKSKLSGVLRRGLRDYFRSEMFDQRWLEEQELEDVENKWKSYKIAESESDLARANFLNAFNACALKASYQNDSYSHS